MRQRLILVLAATGLCLATVGLVAHYSLPDSLYTLGLAAFSAYLGLGAVAAAILFAVVGSRAGWLGCAASVVLVSWMVVLHAPAYVAATAPADGRSLVVMTSNLRVGSADPSAVVAAVGSHHVDVLMLEELTPGIEIALRRAGLDALLPHSVSDARDGGAGTGLWSRFPLRSATERGDLGSAFVSARIDDGDSPVTLAALHVYGPSPRSQFHGWRSDMGEYPHLLGALPGRTAVIGGDFNATPDTAQFRDILDQGFSDAADQAGAGFTPTWPADRWFPPLITIDHVLTRGAVARSVDSIEIPGSDHRALVAVVRLPTRG